MRRQLSLLAAATVAAAVGMLFVPPPASAHAAACTGTVCFDHHGNRLGYPTGRLALGAAIGAVTFSFGSAMLSVKAAASALGVSEQTIRAWCRGGTIPAVRPAGTRKWLIPRDDFVRWFETSGNAVAEFMHADYRDAGVTVAEDDDGIAAPEVVPATEPRRGTAPVRGRSRARRSSSA